MALTSVCIVCRSHPSVAALRHVMLNIDAFLDPSSEWTIPDACRFGSVRLLDRIEFRAKVNGDSTIKCVRSQRGFQNGVMKAMECGHLEVVQWLVAKFPDGKVPSNAVATSAKNGHLAVLRWLFDHHDHVYWGGDEMYCAVAHNHLKVAKFLHAYTSPPSDEMFLIDEAAQHGDLEMMQWLHRERGDQLSYEGVMRAVDHGLLDTVKWMQDTFPGSVVIKDVRMDNAAANGHLDMVKWLQNQHAWCTKQAMNRAAGNGHLDVVKFLDESRSEGCTTDAMDLAAGSGHLGVVKWLHNNRSEGCTQFAMDLAAKNGFLGMMKWLHAHRSEGCTQAAMMDAVSNGHFEVCSWLRETYPGKFDLAL
ncbi:unnamed protein product [Phytophthora fragariaefolia]|uniref:Unnamed protein product n=1 Tax=Phytophthora fragariaefolia TaxID=1490495 RepID=A0A9W6YAC3_9STRA|nr:unnamed protein product [Phytophthora fragariaefolia]